MKKLIAIISLLLILSGVQMALGAETLDPSQYVRLTVTAQNVNLRDAPHTKGRVATRVSKGEAFFYAYKEKIADPQSKYQWYKIFGFWKHEHGTLFSHVSLQDYNVSALYIASDFVAASPLDENGKRHVAVELGLQMPDASQNVKNTGQSAAKNASPKQSTPVAGTDGEVNKALQLVFALAPGTPISEAVRLLGKPISGGDGAWNFEAQGLEFEIYEGSNRTIEMLMCLIPLRGDSKTIFETATRIVAAQTKSKSEMVGQYGSRFRVKDKSGVPYVLDVSGNAQPNTALILTHR